METFPCPECNRFMRKPPIAEVGHWFRCTACHAKFRFNGTRGELHDEANFPLRTVMPTMSFEPATHVVPVKTSRPAARGPFIALVCVGLALVVGLASGVVFGSRRAAVVTAKRAMAHLPAESPLAFVEKVDVPSPAAPQAPAMVFLNPIHQEQIGEIPYVTGVLSNDGGRDCDDPQVVVSQFNSAGAWLGSTTATLPVMNAGDKWTLMIPIDRPGEASWKVTSCSCR